MDLVRRFSPERIGLDPCANSTSIVGARVEWRLDRGEDALTRSWSGSGLVYVNPPYGRKVKFWARKICAEAQAGAEIVALVAARVDTRWFRLFYEHANAICHWAGRIKFLGADCGATFPSAVVYFGPRVEKFKEIFSARGHVEVLRYG